MLAFFIILDYSKVFETLHDDIDNKLHPALHPYTCFDNYDPLSRSQKSENSQSSTLLYLFSLHISSFENRPDWHKKTKLVIPVLTVSQLSLNFSMLIVALIEGLRQVCLFAGSEGDRLAAVRLHAHPGDGHSVWSACAAAERAGEAGPLA